MAYTKNILIGLFAATLLPFSATAQVTFDGAQLMNAKVANITQFTRFFNLEESMNGSQIPKDRKEAQTLRQKQLMSLFERTFVTGANPAKKEMLKQFAYQMTEFAKPVVLKASDREAYILAELDVVFKGQPQKTTVVFKNDYDGLKNNYWTIVSATAPFLSLPVRDKGPSVNETTPDLNQMFLDGQGGAEKLAAYKNKDFEADKYSIFYYLLQNKLLDVKDVKVLSYHFLQVDGWGIVVKQLPGETHSGWLITNVFQATPEIKDDYKNGVLGME